MVPFPMQPLITRILLLTGFTLCSYGALAEHDTVRGASVADDDRYRYDVPIFNPSTEVTQVSRLRLINPGDTAITGRLGAGTGKWRLTVMSDQPLQVVNIVAATAGYWNNLSTTAVPGAAPADLEALNERFVGNAVVHVTGSNRFTLNAQTGERFTETAEIDGVSTTYMGSYGYSAIGPDAGQLTLTYDDGDECAANLYFSTHMAGTYAMTYTVTDEDDDADSLTFTITVEASDDGGDGGSTGADISISNTRCNASRVFPGSPIVDVTTGGTLTANVSVLSVDVTGFANNMRVGSDFVGSISAGESEDFSISGTVIITNATSVDCRVEINYRHRSGVDGSTDAVGISLGGQILN